MAACTGGVRPEALPKVERRECGRVADGRAGVALLHLVACVGLVGPVYTTIARVADARGPCRVTQRSDAVCDVGRSQGRPPAQLRREWARVKLLFLPQALRFGVLLHSPRPCAQVLEFAV